MVDRPSTPAATRADRSLPVIRALWESYLTLAESHHDQSDALDRLRWMIEEFRISCFAQPMKPRVPVSEHKIRQLIDDMS